MRSVAFLRAVTLTTTLSFGSAVVAPTLAYAGAAKEIDVTLKSGAVYHGKLVEKVPGDHVTIELVTGEVKRFEWDDMADEDAEEAPATPKKKSAPKAEPSSSESSSGGSTEGGYMVTIGTNQDGVVLERLVGTTTMGGREAQHWQRVCSAPCNTQVQGGQEYRLGGHGLRKTPLFTIDRDMTIQAKLGGMGGFWAGASLTGSGTGIALVGLIVLASAKEPETSRFYDYSSGSYIDKTNDADDSAKNIGWGITILGVALVGIGVALLLGNANDVQVNGRTIAKASSPKFAGIQLTPTGFVF